jgi:hypothetical protein
MNFRECLTQIQASPYIDFKILQLNLPTAKAYRIILPECNSIAMKNILVRHSNLNYYPPGTTDLQFGFLHDFIFFKALMK